MLKKVEKNVIKNDGRIAPKAHAHLQTMTKIPAKFQKVLYKTVRGVAPTTPCHRVAKKKKKKKKKKLS